ncbi:hypothetical protein CO731_01672 [Aminobacter sp. MSH1]|uniref:hypothetical protein n=1 Tax=Aminobacter sp. MSH1 TaxID=374606 RepID=UPI000D3D0F5D|nr:hypothetical protein [Aminobacter sp. MSH1]AWC22216.1 hypothetical protein CO731_01672 [Aminobacter sp. MSH1]
MKNPFKKTPVGRLKEQIGKFEVGLEQLKRREILVADLLEKGREKRRAFIRDNPGIEVPAEIRHAISVAEDDAQSTKEEIGEYEIQLADLAAALIREQDNATKETAAKADEEMATAIDQQVGPELKKAMAALRTAVEAFYAIVPEELQLVESRTWSRAPDNARKHADHFSRDELLSAVVAEMIYEIAPSLFDRGKTYDTDLAIRRMFDLAAEVPTMRLDGAAPAAVPNTHRTLISDRLRARAAAVLSGQIEPPLATGARSDPTRAAQTEPSRSQTEIYATRDIAYVEGISGRRRLCGRRWVHQVPDLVADVAVGAGFALRTDTEEGRAAFDREKEYRRTSMTVPSAGLSLEDCEDLGDPCGFLGSDKAA